MPHISLRCLLYSPLRSTSLTRMEALLPASGIDEVDTRDGCGINALAWSKTLRSIWKIDSSGSGVDSHSLSAVLGCVLVIVERNSMMAYAQRFGACGRVASVGASSRRLAVSVRAGADDKFDGFKPSVAAFFPGQGAQSVGMAKDLVAEVPKAKEMFDKAKEILGYDLLQVGKH